MKYLVAFLLMLSCLVAAAQPTIPVVDGVVTYMERTDTMHSKPVFVNNGDILIRKDADKIYFAINNGAVGATNLVLIKADTCIVIHISGSLGRAIYQKVSVDSFSVIKPILWVTRNPEAWDFTGLRSYQNGSWIPKKPGEIEKSISDNFHRYGYTASPVDMGSFRDIEAVISRERFKGYRLLIQYRKPPQNEYQLQSTMALYPAQPGLSNQLTTFRTFLEAVPGTAVRIIFSTGDWYSID